MWQNLCLSARELPNENQELLPGVKWGDCGQLYTPAFWKMQYINHLQYDASDDIYKLGSSILEEIVVCLLGGFGMPSEIRLCCSVPFTWSRPFFHGGLSFCHFA
jgi:hypothetical protein